MPIFKHTKTNKAAIWVDTERHSDEAIKIEKPFDLPPMSIWEQVDIHPAMLKQGFTGLNCFLKAFFDKHTTVYYVWVFQSAFPSEAQKGTS